MTVEQPIYRLSTDDLNELNNLLRRIAQDMDDLQRQITALTARVAALE